MLGVARATTVAILRPPSPSATVTETLARLQGELVSVGIAVLLADRPAGRPPANQDPRAWLDTLAAGRVIDAVVDIPDEVSPMAIDVVLAGKPSRSFTVSRVTLDYPTGNLPEKLAIRASEVLRSHLLEIDLSARKRDREGPPLPPSPSLVGQVTEPPHGPPARFTLEAGAAALAGVDGVGAALLPLIRGGWVADSGWGLHAELAGLGSRPTISTNSGSAQVAQQYGVVGGGYRVRPGRGLWPYCSAAVGVLHTGLDGQALPPGLGRAVDQWSFLLDGGLGAGLRITDNYFLSLGAHLHLAAPYVAIHFADTLAATSGRPNLLLTLTLGAWL